MHNCIFTAHCTETMCDKSCPMLVETSYLLERNDISMQSPVFKAKSSDLQEITDILKSAEGSLKVIKTSKATAPLAELYTYCAICQNWKGSRLHCNVYNLKFSKYLEELKKSWSSKVEPESLEYMRIWSNTAKILIISNIDFVNFKDFECQTLLNLIQSRDRPNQTTIVISPRLDSLVGSGGFFKRMLTIFGGG